MNQFVVVFRFHVNIATNAFAPWVESANGAAQQLRVCQKVSKYSKVFVTSLNTSQQLRYCQTQRNSTQLKATLKELALELDIVVTCSPPHPTPPQIFQPLLDQLES